MPENNFATIKGEPYALPPKDLYIPDEALRVFLETFEGPLDLLLYLIRKQNIDILDIPIAEITHQYMQYINLMEKIQLEQVAEYLVMAATLAEIKSKMLLPKPVNTALEDDPRSELINRLREYEEYQQAAEILDKIPCLERDLFSVNIQTPISNKDTKLPQITLLDICQHFKKILVQATIQYNIKRENLSIKERMLDVLNKLNDQNFSTFIDLLYLKEGRAGIVVTFIAILELLKQAMIELVAGENSTQIYLRKIGR